MTDFPSQSFSLDQHQREELFAFFFVDCDETVIRIKKQALGCELEHSKLRIISWKMFLGLLSTPPRAEEWIKELNQQREQFNKLSQKYKQLSLDEIEDPNINNPLSLDKTSPWSVYFEDEKLKKMIVQDIDRTYPEYTYFKQQWVKDMMLDILFIYSKENPEISYRQGMHELLAPVIYMLDQEKIPPSDKSILSKIMDSKFIHHDAYVIFERLMKTTGIWFISKLSKKDQSKNNNHNKKNNHNHDKDKSQILHETPILVKCNHIFHDILKAKDPGLYSYLCSLKLEPQLFLLRWIRVLFGREFRLNETLTLWDAIFAYDKNLTLVDYVAVAMISTIRDKLLSTDQNGVLQLLFKYPVVASMSSFVDQAVLLAKPKPKFQPPTTPTNHTNNNNPRSGMNISLPSQILNINLHFPHQQQQMANSVSSDVLNQIKQLKLLHSNVAGRLDKIVNVMQTDLIPYAGELEEADSILLAVAELKQIKDILKGNLSQEALPPNHRK
jgi:hypothetical protein